MKVAVHLHLYYLEQLPRIQRYLRNLDGQNYDLFVTMVEYNAEAEKSIKSFNPNATIMITPNRGYDVGPFIDFLHKINLDDYDYVLKLHTKVSKNDEAVVLNGNTMVGDLWNHILWDTLLGTKRQVRKCLKQFNNPNIGMIGSKYCLTEEKRTYKKLLPDINNALAKLKFNPVEKVKFIAGTMFYIRAKLLKPLLGYTILDFPPTDVSVRDGALAHVIERVVAEIVAQQNCQIYGISCAHKFFVKKSAIQATIKRFFWQSKITRSGFHIVKVVKLPIRHAKKRVEKG